MSDQPSQSLYGESDSHAGEQVKPLNIIDMISGVFSEPAELFKRLSIKPQWIAAMVLMTALSVAFAAAYALNVNAHGVVAEQLSKTPQIQQLSGAQLDRAIEMGAKIMPFGLVANALFGVPIVMFLSGLIYWAIGMASREDPQWKPTYFHGLVVAAVPALATAPYFFLGILMAFLNPVGTHRQDQIIPSSLGYWLATDNLRLTLVYALVDVFTIAQYVILFFAAKHAMRAKTWGAALCVPLSLPLLMVGLSMMLVK
jgi:hypothetical protein